MRQQVAILAAGRGTRLGRLHPKPLTRLGQDSGRSEGVNYVAAQDKPALIRRLAEVDEVDTPDDLIRANASLACENERSP